MVGLYTVLFTVKRSKETWKKALSANIFFVDPLTDLSKL